MSNNNDIIKEKNDKLFKTTKEKLSIYDTIKIAIAKYFKNYYNDFQHL